MINNKKKIQKKSIKKLIIFGLILSSFLMVGCSPKEEQKNNEIITFETDMSGYENLAEEDYGIYKEVYLESVSDALENNKKAVVFFGYTGCAGCQEAIVELTKIAKENNCTIYYLDAQRIIKQDRLDEAYDILMPILDEAVGEYRDHVIKTPELFGIKDGEFVDFQIGFDAETTPEIFDKIIKETY